MAPDSHTALNRFPLKQRISIAGNPLAAEWLAEEMITEGGDGNIRHATS